MATILRGSDNLDSSKVLSEELAGSIVTDASGRVTMPYQPCISGRIGSAMSHPTSGRIAFGTFWTQQGITYNSSTRRFTVPVAGRYRIMFNAFTIPGYGTYRMILGVNTDTPNNNTAMAQIYSNSNQYQPLPIHATLDLQANDYLVFWLNEGQLYNSTSGDWFNDFSIELIG